MDVSQAVPAPTHLFQWYESFAVILIRPLSLAPFVESDYYFPRHGLCQEGAAVKRCYDISRIIALTADRSCCSHEAFLVNSRTFSTSADSRSSVQTYSLGTAVRSFQYRETRSNQQRKHQMILLDALPRLTGYCFRSMCFAATLNFQDSANAGTQPVCFR